MVNPEQVNPVKDARFELWETFGLGLAYTSVRLNPAPSEIDRTEAEIAGNFSRNIRLETPIVSSPMDTVTESRMAIAMAKAGGLGVIHHGRDMDPEAQRAEVRKVKLHLNGLIESPITFTDDRTLESVLNEADDKGWHFRTFLVEDSDKKFVGIITNSHFKYANDKQMTVGQIMKPAEKVTSAPEGTTIEQAYEKLKEMDGGMLPLLTEENQIAGLYLLSDVARILNDDAAHHSVDAAGRLLTAASVSTKGTDAMDRLSVMEKYLDVVVVDTSKGNLKWARKTVKDIKENYPEIDVVAGNVSDGESTKLLVKAGADGIRVGQGPGAACETIDVTGVGVPQVTAVYNCAKAIRGEGVPVCADGGITKLRDFSTAVAAGADTIMLGSKLAATAESPSEIKIINGQQYKPYRGMGSEGAMKDSAGARDRYDGSTLAEGVEGYVPYVGSVSEVVNLYASALKNSMSTTGSATLQEHQEKTTFILEAPGAGQEGSPHDMLIQ